MSAVHDWAVLVADFQYLQKGDHIEVVGYVWRSYTLCAVYRDDAGVVDWIPAGMLRLEPRVEEKAA